MDISENSSRESIESFLGVTLPEGWSTTPSVLQFLYEEEVQARILERPPFFMLDRAVQLGESALLSVVNMTVDRCAGHFPECPTLPLITLCDAMHQAATALVGTRREKDDEFPVAIEAGPSKALSKHLVRAPAKVLLMAQVVETRRLLYVVNCRSYIDGKPVGSLDGVTYMLLPRRRLVN